MEVLSSYSKKDWATRFTSDLVAKAEASSRAAQSPAPKRAAARLSIKQNESLVAEYAAGASTYELAERYGVRRDTVTARLKRAGVEVRPGAAVALDEAAERRVATLYRDGLSMRSIARQLGVSDNTILKALRAQGVPSRPQMGGKKKRAAR